MRLTVGPLPPAVYWRRRAVVLGAGLIFLLVLFYSFNGPDSGAAPKGGASHSPSAQPKPTAVLTPETESPPPPNSGDPGPPASSATATAAGGIPEAPPPGDGSCSDAEISVIPAPVQTSIRRGASVELRLKIKNVSDRTCSRDVGADLQEIYIRLGATLTWSSDKCSTLRSNDVQSLVPGIEHEYRTTWNGHDSSKCANGFATGLAPEPGDYQVFGRLGTKHSDPVKLTITG